MTLPLDQIEDGTLQMSVKRGCPTINRHDVSDNEWDEILRISETVGEYIEIYNTYSHRFYLYNSQTRGLILIFMNNNPDIDDNGWYIITLFDLMINCLVNGKIVATHPWWPEPSPVNNTPNEYARMTRREHHT